MSVDDLLRLGSEKEVKAAGLFRIEGKDYSVQDGDEIVVRFSV
jgi:ribosome-binding ATPase YchF (GTP1/OBG family)